MLIGSVTPRRVRFHWSLLLLASLTLSAASTARAQPSSNATEPAAYRSLIDDAITEYEARNFAEARSLFSKASVLYPSARALRGVGMAEFELRHYRDSAASLELALKSTVQPLGGELRQETERLRERALGFVARIGLTLDPAETAVFVDGGSVDIGAQKALVLEVGDHTLEFRALGYAPETKLLKVLGGEELTLRIALRPEHAQSLKLTETAQPPSADSDTRRPLYRNPWLWTGVGVAVAAVTVGLAVGLRGGNGGDDSPYGGQRLAGP